MSPADQAILDRIIAENGVSTAGITAAFEQGIMLGAMRAAQAVLAGSVASAPATPAGNGDGDDNDDTRSAPLTIRDIDALKRMGIDPSKKWRQRNTLFSVVGYKPSRWKYPIVVATQNGTRYKMTTAQVIAGQR